MMRAHLPHTTTGKSAAAANHKGKDSAAADDQTTKTPLYRTRKGKRAAVAHDKGARGGTALEPIVIYIKSGV